MRGGEGARRREYGGEGAEARAQADTQCPRRLAGATGGRGGEQTQGRLLDVAGRHVGYTHSVPRDRLSLSGAAALEMGAAALRSRAWEEGTMPSITPSMQPCSTCDPNGRCRGVVRRTVTG